MSEPRISIDQPEDGLANGIPSYLRGVFIAGAWAFVGLVLVAKFWPNLPQRMAFFTGNLFNLIIAFAVVAQVAIYRRQWEVMRKQFEFVMIGERAYVGVVNVLLDNPLAVGQAPSFAVVISNTGRTPAWGVIAYVRLIMHHVSLGEAVEFWPPEQVKSGELGGLIGAGERRTMHYPQEKPKLTSSQLEALTTESLKLYVIGEGHYRDFQGVEHTFPFRAIYSPSFARFLMTDEYREELRRKLHSAQQEMH